ncbi:hypothetical protein C6P40_005271 [Pichia californica]|uniref:BHLH domain-containing protein n=1 Tax=Pichia californica TaxID=460514 RepID=A0A9P6WLG0_9ASCO|nr:hypothetical protein C6P40_005271 [[Candida] californica]
MINPSLERVNSNKGKSGFSPLSSPVLEFQKYNNISTLRQKRKDHHDNSNNEISSNNGEKISIKFDNSDPRSYKRSKTPVTTPLLSATDRKSKHNNGNTNNSSAASSAQTTPYQTYIFKQQQFPNNNISANSNSTSVSSSTSKENSLSTSKSSINISNNLEFTNSFLDGFDGDLTLPPPPLGKILLNDNTSEFIIPNTDYISMRNDDNEITPSTLMSHNSTPKVFSTSSSLNKRNKNNVLLNPNHHKSAQSSPVILPSSSVNLSPMMESKLLNHSSLIASTSNFPSNNSSNIIINSNVPAVGTNILGNSAQPVNSINDHNDENDNNNNNNNNNKESVHHHHHHHHHHGGSDKKMSHKLAEQGRRNRMNIAIQELDKMIPESMKRNITVPSKATTVELGCRYIQDLLDQLQKEGIEFKKDIKDNGCSRSDSISPLDALENNSASNDSI